MAHSANHAGDVLMAGMAVGSVSTGLVSHIWAYLGLILPVVWFTMEIVINASEFIATIKRLIGRKDHERDHPSSSE